MILVILLSYGTLKIFHLVTKHNANVTIVEDLDVFDFTETLNLNEINFRFAFSVVGYHSREIKNDPRYVKYLVRIFGKKEGKEYERLLPYRLCTDSDWDEFYPPSRAFADGIKNIRDDPKQGMLCVDWNEGEDL